ncbi:MAG: hypothetical protein M1840_000724 [Geoglossum simile]|nr:MAG: hypothetical protein M1840_000724 [Geoglossum simile]
MATRTITTISPATNEPVLTRTALVESEIQPLLSASTRAFETFRHTHPLPQRQLIVERALKILADKKDILATELTEQMGRPIAYTPTEITTAKARSEYLLKISDEALADTKGEAEEGFKRYIRKEAIGPILIIFAWNYPYLILVNSLIPAILAGNTVILKPSPQTPTVAERISDIFLEAGLPPNVIQYFHSGSQTLLSAVVRSSEIRLICFTGSVAGGILVQRAASDRVVPVSLELGGKDPAYVRDDVDVEWVTEQIVDGAIFNSGQSCCAVERVYVDEKIHDEFVAAVQKVLKGYTLGDPLEKTTHIGPVISKRSAEVIRSHISDAISKGAKDVTPDNRSFQSAPPNSNFIAPTLLIDVNHDMLVMTEETFGPTIPVMKVKNDEEAVRLMNSGEFGLTASIWTKDLNKGTKLAENIEAGTVFVNRCDFPSPDLAWTGWKNSGRGVTLSRFGYEQFVKLKSFHVKDCPR